MMNIPKRIKSMALGFVLASVPMMGGCGDKTITWQEEVKLLDGRVITVTQKRRIEQNMDREAWLTIKLPEFGDKEIVWHESLSTQVLNLYHGKLYVIANFPSDLEYRKYGRPKPSYVGFRYDAGKWVRIPFSDIPEAIYDTNMYFDNMALYRLKHVSLTDKAAMLKMDTYMPHYKRVDPHYVE